jgi:hypothetical protein
MEIDYIKKKELTRHLENPDWKNVQNFIPIYSYFFKMNETNYNNFQLLTPFTIENIKEKVNHNHFICTLQDLSNEKNIQKEVFIKYSPLIDPTKYLIGKYKDYSSPQLFTLPKLNGNDIYNKITDPNNSAYVDGFFSFISSKLLNHYHFLNGLDCYGNLLCNQEEFIYNVADDIEYVMDSEHFHENINKLFTLESDFFDQIHKKSSLKNKPKLSINSQISLNSVCEIEEIFPENQNEINISETIYDLKINSDDEDNEECDELQSITSCSSRSSHTDNEDDDLNNEIQDLLSEENSTSSEEEDDSDEEEEINVKIPNFPVNMIFLEKCEDTLDSYMTSTCMEPKEWTGLLMQVIMSLIVYQKAFNFTHNDLHTNNIMYVSTEKPYIYYCYDSLYYKVPTFGKIWKIIDFGRAIYRVKGKLICSDSYHPQNGDASTLYNTEPYFNDKKPRLEPNFSFDLCRLGCSLFDFFFTDFTEIQSLKNYQLVEKLIVEWCTDDKGKSILYKKDGSDRYPEFKLYKMIARIVNNHTPQNQLKNSLFSDYKVSKNKINKKTKIINIDFLPSFK